MIFNNFNFLKKFLCRCCCGRLLEQHKHLIDNNPPLSGEIWYPSKCTVTLPTDAYGILEFQGGPHPAKAQVNLQYSIFYAYNYYCLSIK